MAKSKLKAELQTLENEIIETLVAGHKEWRPDLAYPESHSDMQAAVRGLLRMFEVKRRPVAIELEYHDEAPEMLARHFKTIWPRKERVMDDDGRIYSPEASDNQRLGDWQTKAVVAVIAIAALVIIDAIIIFW